MHRVPHAENRADAWRCERSQSYLPLRLSIRDRERENPQRVQCLPHGQDNALGIGCSEIVGGSLAVARWVVGRIAKVKGCLISETSCWRRIRVVSS